MKDEAAPAPGVEALIFEVRGQKVILDSDLARIYGVPTKALNQAAKRNRSRFPADFGFRLTDQEAKALWRSRSQTVTLNERRNRSQIVTGSQKHRDPRFLPYAFTEHGAIMAANALNSDRAVQMSVFVVRAFVTMRSALKDKGGGFEELRTRDVPRVESAASSYQNGAGQSGEEVHGGVSVLMARWLATAASIFSLLYSKGIFSCSNRRLFFATSSSTVRSLGVRLCGSAPTGSPLPRRSLSS